MSDFDDAFSDLLDANASAQGGAETVTINATDYTAIVKILNLDDMYIGGGTAQSGTVTAMVAEAALSPLPARGDPATVRGRNLQVLSTNLNDCYIEIVFGDQSA